MKRLKDFIVPIIMAVLLGVVLWGLVESDLEKQRAKDRYKAAVDRLDKSIEVHNRLIDEIEKKIDRNQRLIDRNQRLIDKNQRILDAMPWNHKVPSLSELPERDTPAWSNWIERVQRDALCY